MSLNIKNDETVRLARELATMTGESITRAITVAVSERLKRVRPSTDDGPEQRLARIREITRGSGSLWKEPYKSQDHGELLYDELGLPR